MSNIQIDANNRITIKGAREHNLKNVNLTLPRNKLIVMTGLSGSGKSSLAVDTIFSDGQRRTGEEWGAPLRAAAMTADTCAVFSSENSITYRLSPAAFNAGSLSPI